MIASYDSAAFELGALASGLEEQVSVCVPTLNEAGSIGRLLDVLRPALEAGLVDQVAVVDSGSEDGTPELARRQGVEVFLARELLPEFGPVLGKGDVLWRALSVLRGEIVCFLDADSADPGLHFVLGLLGPFAVDPRIEFVKAFYRRPFRVGDEVLPEGGGRVNELLARPLLRALRPELAAIRQPLAGEVAARRALLERIPFATGYGVEIGMLLDVCDAVAAEAICQVDLRERQNRHQPLQALGPMADEVLATVLDRVRRRGQLTGARLATGVERPPFVSLARVA
jgi:glucosyl-3-phosphoglycerate synthase